MRRLAEVLRCPRVTVLEFDLDRFVLERAREGVVAGLQGRRVGHGLDQRSCRPPGGERTIETVELDVAAPHHRDDFAGLVTRHDHGALQDRRCFVAGRREGCKPVRQFAFR